MPQTVSPIALTPGKPVNIIGANAGLVIKGSKGSLLGLSVNTAGTGSTLVVYDGTSTSGVKIGTFSTTAQASFNLNWQVLTGLFVVTTGTVADVTITYS